MKRDSTGKFVRNWELESKQRVSVTLTSTAWRSLDAAAQKQGISRSELIEGFARSLGTEEQPDFLEIQATAENPGLQECIANLEQQIQHLETLVENTPDTIARIAAQESERKVIAILESITDAFVAFDCDWRYTYINQAAANILHQSPEELLGKNVWHEVFPELVDGIAYQAMHRAVAQQLPVSWEEYGEPVGRWLEVHAYPSAEGVAVYFRDITERKQAEAERDRLIQELEIEHGRFAAVLRQLPTGVLIADAATGTLVLANEQAKQIVGYSYEESLELEEYVPLTPFVAFGRDGEMYAPDDYPLARSLRTGEVISNEELALQNDGKQTVISVNSAPILNSENQIVAAVAIFQDITERKQIETALRQQTEALENQHKWLETVLDLMPTATVFVEPVTGKISFANRIADELAGGEIPKNKVFDEYIDTYYCTDANGEPIPREKMPLVLLATGKHLQNYQINWHTPGGIRSTLCWGETLPAMYGYPETGICMFQDVTHLKQIEENLRQTEERLQLALSSAQIVAWDMDLVNNRVVCSLNSVCAWGLEASTIEEFVAKIHPEDRQQVLQAAEKAAAGERIYQQEYRVITPDGTVRWLNSQGRVYLDATGRGARMIGVSVDITERQQLLEALQHKEKQQEFLIQLNEAIRAIVEPKEIMWQVVCATGQHFQVTRCTYGEIDSTQEYLIVDRDYCNGVKSAVGSHHMNSFGREIIAELKQGKTIVVDDLATDPRTRGAGAAAFAYIGIKSIVCVPLVKQGKFVALFVLDHISPRHWRAEEVALIEQIAEQTWLAVERSRAEEALRESEAHLQLALNFGRMGSWDWEVQTGALHWSEGHFTVLGLQPYECQPAYEVWASRVHPDDLATAEATLEQAMHQRKDYHHEYRLRWTDGSIHWVEARGQATYDSQGKPKNSIGVVIDITERKQAEQERERLLERERIARMQVETIQRQLATIFETSPVGMGLLDSQQRFIAINEALAQINGLTREQHLGYSIPQLFGESDPRLVAVFDEIYNTGNRFISPNFAVNVPARSDRSPGYYNVYYLPTTNAHHQVEDVLVYVVDVTERVRLERDQRFLGEASAVLASSLDYQTTLERVAQLAVPELADWCTVHIVKEDGCIEQIAVAHADPGKLQWAEEIRCKYPLNPDDPRGAALTLRTGESQLVTDIPDELLVQAARNPEHLEILRSVGFKAFMSVPLRTQNRIFGVISFISAESGQVYDQGNLQLAEELAHRASLAIDNAQLYRRAQSDRAKAEATNRIKDEFLAVLSHELRSPLNPILGWTKLLRSQQLNPAKIDQALETIERNAKLQAQLIEDLLDVSRILQGKMSLNVSPVNLAATIEAANETVRLAAEAKNIHIQTILNPISGTVSGDTNRLQQVIWNLLANAVKFTPPGGEVEVELQQVGMYAQIQVTDTGIGISREFLPYVFEYFRQEDGATTRKFGGLGLGLAIVRHLTELHGGTVFADSPGQNMGATFTVKLPLNVVESDLSGDASNLQTAIDLNGMQILVVDDDADMRDLAEFILTQAGAQVTTADSALQVLTLLQQSLPDLLISDIGMPEMDGYCLIRQIRQYPPQQGGNLPAIALSAYAGEINQQQALQAGFQQHIPKPIDPDELVRIIALLMGNITESRQ
ncbi:PAS domain S-box protein [Calothrix sp. FACHB-1219]|uniref:PAS domain S-box protein n=1 Tax=unclassified Calothrix TaxID=2619626 RepID=UPI001683A5A4|nr:MULTISPECIES: PAS domain S-box protein [unclassified Calothrix]MBD2205960.1 PAS domain S-box protein [Calothrix sp. FACHB-168]MBD2218158.1 PAS domain S-box protein [Calothrix sp. FACHB-1219]